MMFSIDMASPSTGPIDRSGASDAQSDNPGEASQGRYLPLHHPCYDFNDDVLPDGVRWFVAVVSQALGAAGGDSPR